MSNDRPDTELEGSPAEVESPSFGLIESIDRLAFFARLRASDATLNARYAVAYVSVLRKRLADVGEALTALSAVLPSDVESMKTQSRPPKAR